MGKWALAAVAAIPLLLLGYCNLPETSCAATWRDVEGEDLVAPIDACRHEPDTRKVGGLAFARIGEDVYHVERWERRQPGGPVCMIGVACFPLYERPRKERQFLLVRLEGPVDLAHLRSYLDDRILSDGSVVFDSLQRVPPLEPALDLTQLRAALPGSLVPEYVTDGRWVLYGGHVLPGADPSTLEAVPIAFIVPDANPLTLSAVVRDRHAVFFRSQRIDGADRRRSCLSIMAATAYTRAGACPIPAGSVWTVGTAGTCRTKAPSRSGSVRSITGTCARNSPGCGSKISSPPPARRRTSVCQKIPHVRYQPGSLRVTLSGVDLPASTVPTC